MYEKYYGLINKPFEITPDPGFFFFSEKHKEALAHLRYAVREGKGFSVITGEVGTGKTTLVHMLLSNLGQNVRTANIFNPLMSPADFLTYVCIDLGIQTNTDRTRGHNLMLLYNFLLECFNKKQLVFLIIDEAQCINTDILEEVRLLTNFETSKNKLLHIILLGQPELNETLADKRFRALKQRITVRYNLNTLNFNETKEYVKYRLKKAGGRNLSLFDNNSLKEIYNYSKGIPRLINTVCDHALIIGFSRDLKRIGKPVIREAIRDLEGLQGNRKTRFLHTIFVILLILIFATIATFILYPRFFERIFNY
ncbi:MAG: AAA family ATPase [Desulfobacterium sp.]|nr:AAA family ATPase [Desulfobacterium sp.]MBU4036405.1 AAA family ATPase [Pseudomonadota bacterium]